MRTGEVEKGGSTITQQLVKNRVLSSERTAERKLREMALALAYTERYSKREILEQYLNTVYFGNGAYGVQAAAQTYFNADATELSLPQAALLAGLIRAPVDYDPVAHPTHARQRRNRVLDAMLEQGLIDQATHDVTAAQEIELDLGEEDHEIHRWLLADGAGHDPALRRAGT